MTANLPGALGLGLGPHWSNGTLVLADGTEYQAKFRSFGAVGDVGEGPKSGDLDAMKVYIDGEWKKAKFGKKAQEFYGKTMDEIFPFSGKDLDGVEPCDLPIIS